MNRIATGIPNFDALIEGGFPEGTTTLLSGPTGSGKSILGIQFLYNGITHFDEKGIFVTLETRPDDIRLMASQFGWDLSILEDANQMVIIDGASSRAQLPTSERYALKRGFDMETLAEMIYEAITALGARRLVLDSISGLLLRFKETSEVRRELYRLSSLLNELKVTSLFIGEDGLATYSGAGVEQFVTQGYIILDVSENAGELQRSLLVRKMRFTHHSLKRHRFVIGNTGIKLLKPRSSSK